MNAEPQVAICVVTHNEAEDLPACFAAVAGQSHRPLELVVVDCDSADDSVEVARTADAGDVPRRVIDLGENRGFSGGMNRAFRESEAPYLMTLNADAVLRRDYVRRLLERLRANARYRVGAATGRLIRLPDADGERRLDACGMYLTRNWRHLDRGSGELDRGQWDRPERVFGATGAAALFARAAFEDVSLDGEVFDRDFHTYREDAELCFRLQERGWEVVYEPAAVAEHRRRVLPERRRRLSAFINRHSLKNRYLLRAYHQTPANALRTLVPTLLRDVLALGYVVLVERSSLSAYRWLWQHRRRILARRKRIQARRNAPPAALERWFRHRSLPL